MAAAADAARGWRAVAVVWCAVALAYVAYAGATYTGLYQWLADAEQAWFGAFDPGLTFVALLVTLCLPALLLAPRPRHAAMRVAEPHAPATGGWVWAIAGAALLAGLGAGGLAAWQGARTPLVVSIALASGSEVPQADQLIVTGRAQRSRTVVLTETTRGSTSQTAYTPLTSADWTPRQPIRFMMREQLAAGTDATPSSDDDRVVRFGPAAVLRHELPGVVRAGLNRGGLILAPDAVLLDENLASASYGLWIVAFFGCVMAIGLGVTRWLVARAQGKHAVGAGPALSKPPGRAARPGASRSPQRWRLMLGSELMAELTLDSYETPWITVAVSAHPGLHAFWRYFTDAKTWPDNDPAIEAMVAEVDRRGGFTLFDDEGLQVEPFTLVNLDETSANLRC